MRVFRPLHQMRKKITHISCYLLTTIGLKVALFVDECIFRGIYYLNLITVVNNFLSCLIYTFMHFIHCVLLCVFYAN